MSTCMDQHSQNNKISVFDRSIISITELVHKTLKQVELWLKAITLLFILFLHLTI